MSTLGYALLALLNKKPGTAYELAQRMRRPVGYFWNAGYGQIHPQLRDLAASGLVSDQLVPGPGPHDKRVFTITAGGRTALAGWVVQPPAAEPTRDELLLKAYAIGSADPAAARRMLAEQAEVHRALLTEYQAIRRRIGQVPPAHPDFGSLATLRYGIGYQRHRLRWCQWLAATLGQSAAE